MRFRRLGPAGQEIPVVVDAESRVFDLTPVTEDIDGGFLGGDGAARAADALERGSLELLANSADLRVGPPIVRPQAVICIGQNYAAHAAESGDSPPRVPIMFFKHPNTVVGPYDNVHLPPNSTKLDWEVELGVVIGRRARYLATPDDSSAHIAGYVVSHDVSERTWQVEDSGGQWSKGKVAETFNPLGPELVTAQDLSNPQNLRLWSTVNGEPRQDSTTADMVFTIDFLVWHLSQYMVLEPGDVINTGTPQGVGISGRFPYLSVGDVVELGIEGLGVQRQVVVAAP
ncbi:MAG: fumarylacetoacetate hydrolase family protein [Microcella sp.]|uniref:fumarylacetoacetate hydrolase family protein n=1 Tax=Microcella sp. TaxID=1913979 RepID=UPI003315F5A5